MVRDTRIDSIKFFLMISKMRVYRKVSLLRRHDSFISSLLLLHGTSGNNLCVKSSPRYKVLFQRRTKDDVILYIPSIYHLLIYVFDGYGFGRIAFIVTICIIV